MQENIENKRTNYFNDKKIYISIGVIVGLIVIFIISAFRLFTQRGEMMAPTFKNDAILVTYHFPFFQNFINRGSTVIFKVPQLPYPLAVMRVVGLPGERVMLEGGKIYIDGAVLDENNYLNQTAVVTDGEPYIDDGEPKLIPNNMYMVLGDNRQFSADSRTFGFVPKENITGLVGSCVANCK